MYDWEDAMLFGMRSELGWIGMLVFVVLVLLGGIALVRWLAATGDSRPRELGEAGTRTAEELLRERYARGEVDAAEFQRRLDDLRASRRND